MPLTLSPVVPERHAGNTRVLACKPCAHNRHPDWNTAPEWAYPLPHPMAGWDNAPAVVLIDHTYTVGDNARLYRARVPMCPSHAEFYLGREGYAAFMQRQELMEAAR